MKIRKGAKLETDIISLIGMSCTGGVLLIWAKDTFGRKAEEGEERENVFDYLWGLYDYATGLLQKHEVVEEEETEQAWKTYTRQQEPLKVKPAKYEITI